MLKGSFESFDRNTVKLIFGLNATLSTASAEIELQWSQRGIHCMLALLSSLITVNTQSVSTN